MDKFSFTLGIVALAVAAFLLGTISAKQFNAVGIAGHPDCAFTCDNLMQK